MKSETDILVQIAIEENKLPVLEQILSTAKTDFDASTILYTRIEIEKTKTKIETLNWILKK
jgi:hypothetical protein